MLDRARTAVWRIQDQMSRRVECNLCGWTGRAFWWVGAAHKRRRGRCPRCDSRERHRLAHHLLEDRLTTGGDLLHFAPEAAVAPWLKSIAGAYLSADLLKPADVAEDITALTFPDDRFDLVYCSHVLEHVQDDDVAMREIARVLRPGGVAVVQVPIRGEVTDEDSTVTDPRERERRWNQWDHVRWYGMDVVDRLEAAGLTVRVLDLTDLDRAVVTRFGLDWPATRQVFLCTLPAEDDDGPAS